ncbi:MAG TPA: serine hydrolase domain-containing protein [Pseudonocardia sp.]
MTIMLEGLQEATQAALLRRLATEQRDGRAPSMVAGVVRDGELLWWGGRGQVDGSAPDDDTQYRLGSITKTYVAVLVMRLRDEGRLDLTDPLDRHLPGTPFGDRSIAALLSQSGGVTAEPPGPWWERTEGRPWPRLAEDLDAESVRFRAHRRYHYSNLGFGALGELVARLRGMPWSDALHAEILAPLGLTRTSTAPNGRHASGYAVHPWADALLPEPSHDAVSMAPAGQLWSTVRDLARWTAFLDGDTAEVLHPDTVAEMREPQTVADGDRWESGYGLGLQLFRRGGRRFAGHTGSMPGFLATALTDPAEHTGALVMANTTSGPRIDTVVTDLVKILATQQPRLPGEWRPLPEVDRELLAVTGPWYWGPKPFAMRLLPDRWLDLAPLGDTGRASRFRHNPDGTWTGLDGYYTGEILTVIRAQDGTPRHLELNTFILTREPYDRSAPIPGEVDRDGWRGR